MTNRNNFIEEQLEIVGRVVENLDEAQLEEPDFAIVRELAEQLSDELEALYD